MREWMQRMGLEAPGCMGLQCFAMSMGNAGLSLLDSGLFTRRVATALAPRSFLTMPLCPPNLGQALLKLLSAWMFEALRSHEQLAG